MRRVKTPSTTRLKGNISRQEVNLKGFHLLLMITSLWLSGCTQNDLKKSPEKKAEFVYVPAIPDNVLGVSFGTAPPLQLKELGFSHAFEFTKNPTISDAGEWITITGPIVGDWSQKRIHATPITNQVHLIGAEKFYPIRESDHSRLTCYSDYVLTRDAIRSRYPSLQEKKNISYALEDNAVGTHLCEGVEPIFGKFSVSHGRCIDINCGANPSQKQSTLWIYYFEDPKKIPYEAREREKKQYYIMNTNTFSKEQF